MMQGFAAIAEELVRRGVRDVFTFTAKDVCELVAELRARGVAVHHARHEHIAVGMADGYYRASGRLGVVVVGQGVGVTNCINALLTAAKAHSRVLVLAGDVPGAGTQAARIQRKYVDQPGLMDVLGVSHVDLQSSDSVVADIARCFELARRGRDPLLVNLPDEVMQRPAGTTPTTVTVPDRARPPLSAADREVIVELLTEPWLARRTVIVAGRGASVAGARADLVHLAAATGALLGTSVMAKGLFSGEPYAIGVVGTFATPVASEQLAEARLVLAFGASLNYDTTYNGTIFGKARIVHIDDDPAALGRFQAVDLAVVADARLAAAALADELERRGARAEGYRSGDLAAQLAAYRSGDGAADRSGPAGLDPRAVMLDLDRRLPRERTVVVDGGNFMSHPILHLAVPDEAAFLWPLEYGAIGCSLGTALGAAIARPERLTVLVIGDGGLMMTLADLDTAVRERLALLVVVCNNSALLAELRYLIAKGYAGEDGRNTNPSFEAVARGLGCEALTVRELADLDRIGAWLANPRGPLVLDCLISPEIIVDTVSFAMERARGGAMPAAERVS